MAEFEASIETFASCKATMADKIQVVLTKEFQIWLANRGDAAESLSACELFGYGLGSFGPTPVGVAKSSGDTLTPWHLSSDLSLMVFVDPAANTKTIKSLAEIACDTTRTSGITDLSSVDHDVNPKLDASGHPMSFRHLPVPKTKINAFEPKALSPDVERQNMRATMLGATMAGNLKKIPCTDWAQMLFEVKLNPSPAIVTPLKPKYWLTCALEKRRGWRSKRKSPNKRCWLWLKR